MCMARVKWNFEKVRVFLLTLARVADHHPALCSQFLLDRQGRTVARFSSLATPSHLEKHIVDALGDKAE